MTGDGVFARGAREVNVLLSLSLPSHRDWKRENQVDRLDFLAREGSNPGYTNYRGNSRIRAVLTGDGVFARGAREVNVLLSLSLFFAIDMNISLCIYIYVYVYL